MNFNEQKEYVKKSRTIDGSKFKNVKEITMMLDFINQEVVQGKESRLSEDIHYMARDLAKLFRKYKV